MKSKPERKTVSFSQNDLDRLNKLQDALGVNTLAETLSRSIEIADQIRTHRLDRDRDIYYHDNENGHQGEILFPFRRS